jgi:multidrug efflux pump subunit AcrB
VFSEIKGIEHVFSVSRPGMAVITVQYKVGEDNTDAVVRLFSKVLANQDWLPPNLGVGTPIVKPKGIDDVPIITATLWSDDPDVGAFELGQVAHALEQEIKRVPGTRDVFTVGAPAQMVRVLLDPQALAGYDIDLSDLRRTCRPATPFGTTSPSPPTTRRSWSRPAPS